MKGLSKALAIQPVERPAFQADRAGGDAPRMKPPRARIIRAALRDSSLNRYRA
jgi:hypothetical protein